MARLNKSDRKPTEGQRTDIARNEHGLDTRQYQFCLFYLASQGKKPKWAAGQAGYSGDLAKRSRSLLEQPVIQAFLEKYAPPVNRFKVTGEKASLLKRLEQIASGEGIDKTVIAQLKAIELRGKAEGLWEGTSREGREKAPRDYGSNESRSRRERQSALCEVQDHVLTNGKVLQRMWDGNRARENSSRSFDNGKKESR